MSRWSAGRASLREAIRWKARPRSALDDSREHFGVVLHDEIGHCIVGRGGEVDDHRGAPGQRDPRKRGRGVHLQRRADDEEGVAVFDGVDRLR